MSRVGRKRYPVAGRHARSAVREHGQRNAAGLHDQLGFGAHRLHHHHLGGDAAAADDQVLRADSVHDLLAFIGF